MSNEEKILSMLENLTGRVNQIQDSQTQMQADISGLQAGQAQMQADMGQMQADMGQMQADMGQMQADMGQMQTTITRMAVTQENVVLPKLQLLAEGHDTLLNTLAHKDRVEALEDDMALLKTVIKAMSKRIEDLEKAGSETA